VKCTGFQCYDVWAQQNTGGDAGIPAKEIYIAPNVHVSPKEANRWYIKYAIQVWTNPNPDVEKDWCTINPDTGTIHLEKDKCPHLSETNLYSVQISVKLWDGEMEPSVSTYYTFTVLPAKNSFNVMDGVPEEGIAGGTKTDAHLTMNKSMVTADPTLIFGETATVSLIPDRIHNPDGDTASNYCHDIVWHMPNQDFVKFVGTRIVFSVTNQRWEAEDYGHSIPLQAVSNAGSVVLSWWFTSNSAYDANNGKKTLTMTINVINDLVAVSYYTVEAPSVGNPLSTPQLYLESNCGNQIYFNPVGNPNTTMNIQVSATLQNCFSPG
jgi:hypothetical protein